MILKKSSINENIVFMCITLISINFVLYRTLDFWVYKDAIRIIANFCLLVNIATYKQLTFKKTELCFIAYIIIGLFVSFNNFLNVTSMYLLILNLYHFSNEKKIKQVFFSISLFNVLIIVFLLVSGLSTNEVIRMFGRTRYTFGFSNVNSFSVVFLSLISFILLITKNKAISLFVLVSTYISYKFTDSRTPMIMISIYFILIIFRKIIFTAKKTNIFVSILISFIFFSTYFSSIIDVNFPQINELLSLRISIFIEFIKSSLLNFIIGFGRTQFIDNSFLVLGSLFGIGGLLIIMFLTRNLIINLIKNGSTKKAILIVSYLLACMMESYLILPEMLLSIYFWFLIFDSLKNKGKTIQNRL